MLQVLNNCYLKQIIKKKKQHKIYQKLTKEGKKGKFYSASSFKNAFFMDMIQYLIDTNVTVEPIPINGRWCEIDTQLDLERAKEIFSY